MIGIGVYAKYSKTIEKIGSQLPVYMDPAILLISIGSIIFVLSFMGCIGSLRENICLLRMFEYTITLLLLVEIALAVYVYVDRNRVKRGISSSLETTIVKYRDDPDLQSIIDWTQMNVKCCGVNGYDDWNKNIYFNCSFVGVYNPEKCGVPFSCCKNYEKDLNTQCGYNIRDQSVTDLERSNTIWKQNCVDGVISMLLSEDNLILIVAVAGAIVLLQLITTGMAHSLVQGIRRQMQRWGGAQGR